MSNYDDEYDFSSDSSADLYLEYMRSLRQKSYSSNVSSSPKSFSPVERKKKKSPVKKKKQDQLKSDPRRNSQASHHNTPKSSFIEEKLNRKGRTQVKTDQTPQNTKKKHRSKEEVDEIYQRLSKVPEKKVKNQDGEEKPKRKAINHEIFNQLYEKSNEKFRKIDEVKVQKENEELEEIQKSKIKQCKKSRELADKKYTRFYKSCFAPYEESEISHSQLLEILTKLGITHLKQNIQANNDLDQAIKSWQIEESDPPMYELEKVKEEIMSIIDNKCTTPFQKNSRPLVVVAISNAQKEENMAKMNQDDENQKKEGASMMTRQSIERLSIVRNPTPKPESVPDPQQTKRPERVFKKESPPPKPKQHKFQDTYVSEMPFIERAALYNDLRSTKIQQKREEMYQEFEQGQLIKHGKMPKFDSKTRTKIDSLRARRDMTTEEPTYKPKVTTYKEYMKIRKSMWKEVRPKGWDSAVTNSRIAYRKSQQKKRDSMSELDSYFPSSISDDRS